MKFKGENLYAHILNLTATMAGNFNDEMQVPLLLQSELAKIINLSDRRNLVPPRSRS